MESFARIKDCPSVTAASAAITPLEERVFASSPESVGLERRRATVEQRWGSSMWAGRRGKRSHAGGASARLGGAGVFVLTEDAVAQASVAPGR